jgi:hypothetical protein
MLIRKQLTWKHIAMIVVIVLVLPAVAWQFHSDVALYGMLAAILGLAIVVCWWELHKMQARRKLWPKMSLPSQGELASTSAAPVRPSDTNIRAEYGFPPKIDDFFGEVSSTTADGWNYQLWLEEWAELYLGGEEFASLDKRFASTPGVSRVTHMDREVFLIKTGQLTPGQIRQAFWQHFLEAAKGGRESVA